MKHFKSNFRRKAHRIPIALITATQIAKQLALPVEGVDCVQNVDALGNKDV